VCVYIYIYIYIYTLLGKTTLKVTYWKNESRMVCKGTIFSTRY